MTKRKAQVGPYSRLELAQFRLRKIALALSKGQSLSPEDRQSLSPEDLSFLTTALDRIGAGDDANEVLGVKAGRGERKTVESAQKKTLIELAMSWIAAVIIPKEEGGLGKTLDQAFEAAARQIPGNANLPGDANLPNNANFGLSEDTLRQYWADYPQMRRRSFKRPIHTLPDERDIAE
jgi:hypothetical protein